MEIPQPLGHLRPQAAQQVGQLVLPRPTAVASVLSAEGQGRLGLRRLGTSRQRGPALLRAGILRI